MPSSSTDTGRPDTEMTVGIFNASRRMPSAHPCPAVNAIVIDANNNAAGQNPRRDVSRIEPAPSP